MLPTDRTDLHRRVKINLCECILSQILQMKLIKFKKIFDDLCNLWEIYDNFSTSFLTRSCIFVFNDSGSRIATRMDLHRRVKINLCECILSQILQMKQIKIQKICDDLCNLWEILR